MYSLAFGALGVVYGDIGTSPLYAFKETFHGHHLPVDETSIYGACSLVFWALIIVISLKYLTFIMKADNRGEGGILALTALVAPPKGTTTGRRRAMLILLGLFGCALLYGDGIITPAISVLSAIEGTEEATDAFSDWVIPLALVILVSLFAVQKRGTAGIGKVFGPIMLLWFTVLAVLGVRQIVEHPEIIKSINPLYAIDFFPHLGMDGFLALGSIFLVVTGGEALYADMGHFGRRPIALGWFGLVMPCLLLNYWGQGALLLENPEAIEGRPFFQMGPEWSVIPLVVLATCATVIASQALISGAFSLTAQAVQMDYLPRLDIQHTSAAHSGQIYVPVVNWLLMGACLATVVGFQTSTNLAAAYGIAVTSTMAITTLLFGAMAVDKWGWSKSKALAVVIPFLLVDLAFFAANVPKIPHGGWFPLAVGVTQLTLMATWRKGRELVAARIKRGERPIADFIDDIESLKAQRVPGTAVFLFKDRLATPPALISNVRHNHVLHRHNLLVALETEDIPRVDPGEQVEIIPLGRGFFQVVLHYGFMEEPDVATALFGIDHPDLILDVTNTTFFLGHETVVSAAGDGMAPWRERLFAFQNQTASSASRFFNLPAERVYEVGSHVEI